MLTNGVTTSANVVAPVDQWTVPPRQPSASSVTDEPAQTVAELSVSTGCGLTVTVPMALAVWVTVVQVAV